MHGRPIHWVFLGSTGSTSQSISLILPGSNVSYNFLPTDWLTLISMNATAVATAGEVVVLNATAGQSTVFASTLLLSFGTTDTGTAEWHDESSDAMAASQGVLPSVLGIGAASTSQLYVSGTAFIQHAPGTAPPEWLANQPTPSTQGDSF